MPNVLGLYSKLSPLPAGRTIFSVAFCQIAPYFGTVRPRFTVLEPNHVELTIKKRRKVHNHIKTVHVIAICNGLEAAMGALAEATIPANKRWIPKGMDVEYVAMATSDITCIAETDQAQWDGDDPHLPVRVRAERADGTVVVQGVIHLWVTEKKSQRTETPGTEAAATA